MSDDVQQYRGKNILVRFEGSKCIHSRNCVLGRPDVFVPNAPGEWIQPDGASAEDVAAIARSCPSGAIRYERIDGAEQEAPPPVNVVRVRENGPLAMYADIALADQPPMLRATLCRCGASKTKPFCDASHVAAGFVASGEPVIAGVQDSPALEQRGGKLEVKPLRNGPLLVTGNVEVVTGTGHTVTRTQKAAFCRCGASEKKPFCDGSHLRIGFKSE
jgi:CDGSH-type Zn-finger protein/uncharacterized Fe-S cluster protein YjdI